VSRDLPAEDIAGEIETNYGVDPPIDSINPAPSRRRAAATLLNCVGPARATDAGADRWSRKVVPGTRSDTGNHCQSELPSSAKTSSVCGGEILTSIKKS